MLKVLKPVKFGTGRPILFSQRNYRRFHWM